MNALEFYKSHESAPLPNVGDLVSLTVEELCELMEQYHQSKVNNGVLDDVIQQRELLAFRKWQKDKLNISDVSDSDEMILTKREIINLLHDWERGMDWYFEYNDKTKEILDFIGRWNNGEYEIW